MKKAIKIILGILELIAVALTILIIFVPSVASSFETTKNYVFAVTAALTTIWVIIICIRSFNKEAGKTQEVKFSFREDKERHQPNIDESDTQEVYSNFERAEFATKIKEPYQKKVVSFTESFSKPTSEEAQQENKDIVEIPTAPVKVQEEPVVEEKAEETPVEVVPVIEETPTVEETPSEPEVAPVITPSKPVRELKPLMLWDGFEINVLDGWTSIIEKELKKGSTKDNMNVVKNFYESGKIIYPTKENLMKPFQLTDFRDVKVVIIGKIPFYRKNQADGLAFSTDANADINQSTNIIINEAIKDVGIAQPDNGSLEKWAKEGVLLINSCLSAPSDKPASHMDYWKDFTRSLIIKLIDNKEPKVFVLWGEHCQEFKPLIEQRTQHLIIEAPSPSPLSANNGFYGSKPFSKINEFLVSVNKEPINWELK